MHVCPCVLFIFKPLQPANHVSYDRSPPSDLSQQSLIVPSQNESCSDDQAVPRHGRKKPYKGVYWYPLT